uniref:Uncharacterized protein n=1 Tax=viral metagenome TaxID=1070528 RepID=A0A6C0FET0_9ZZZZ|tara:strand:- start:14379 stop:19691 length:5313 start_codon:yes stop_codon:yes gene_type:complete
MSDPYLDFSNKNDASNIQVNIFHVSDTLRGTPMEKRNDILHKECYVFNPENSKPTVLDIDCKPKVVKDKIYLTDTIEILFSKIAQHCVKEDISGKRIFAWLDLNPKNDYSLRYCLPLGIQYDDLGSYMNLFSDKKYDDRFCSPDGESKRETRFSSDIYSSYKSYYDKMRDIKGLKPNTNIYFCTLDDAIKYSKKHMKKMSDVVLLNGLLKKYFPLISEINEDDSEYHAKILNKIEKIDTFKSLQKGYRYFPISCRPTTLIYENRFEENSIDLFKIFKEFTVDEKTPYIRIFIDNYLDSCMKLDRNSIYNEYSVEKKTVTKEIFEIWNRSIMIHNGFTMPERIDMINTLSFIIYDKDTTNYATMLLYSDGKIKLYCGSMMRISEFSNKVVIGFINRANGIIRKLNNSEISQNDTKLPILYKDPERIDCSYVYELPDYNQTMLAKPFKKFYTEFTILEDSQEEPLHLLYNKSSGFYDPKKLYSFISLLKKRNTDENKIMQVIKDRYGLSLKTAKEEIENWTRAFQGKFNRNDFRDIGISIIIEKVLDRVKVSFIGLGGFSELHECMDTINFIMGLYKAKRIDKESLKSEYSDLFKKGSDKEVKEYTKPDETFTEVVHQELPEIREPVREEIVLPPSELDQSSADQALVDQAVAEDQPREEIVLQTDEVHEEDEEDEDSDEDSDEEDDYGRISSSSDDSRSSSGGGGSILMAGGGKEEDESKYPNKRYYIKRLEQRDPKLIKFKPKNSKDGYSYKCQAVHDKQPIVLTKAELDEIDEKTGFKNEGISYSKAIQIQGGDRPELYYICPKFWDRKHQIPLDPLNKIHPIEGVDYTPFVYSKEMKDNDCFILERTGRPANRTDQDSYWNRNEKDKDDISKYNIQFILDDVHPDLLALPCCGKKPVKYDISSYVNVLIQNPGEKSYWEMGKITGKINSKDEYPITIKGSKSQYFHISLLKPFKGSNDRLSNDFPLKKNSNGHVHPILKDLFHVRKEDPILNKSENNGFFRKGIQQGSDSFLECLDLIHRENRNNPSIKRDNIDLDRFKKDIIKDIKSKNFDIYSVGGGSFVQYFRDENVDLTKTTDKIRESVLDNFEKYLNSNEPKDDKIISPLIKSISNLPNNSTFEGYKFNLIVFEEVNESIRIREPIGKFQIDDDYPFAYIFKKDMIYEPLIYHYGSSNYGYVLSQTDNDIKKGDDIKFTDTIAKCVTIKKNVVKIVVKDSEEVLEVPKEELQKYDMKSVNDIVYEFINKVKSKVGIYKREYMTEEDLDLCLQSLNFTSSKKGYVDTYNKLCMIEYREKMGKGFKRMVFPIKPKSYDADSYVEKVFPIKNVSQIEIDHCIKTLKRVDKKCKELFEDKYASYLNDSTMVIVNYKDKNIGILLQSGIILPLVQKRYNSSKYKYDTIVNTSLIELQNDYVLEGKSNDDEFSEYFDEYNTENESIYQEFSKAYLTIYRDKKLREKVSQVINHPVKLDIHKRWDLFDAFSQNDDISLKDKMLKKFIEIILIHGLDEINKVFIHSFVSLKDIKMKSGNTNEIVLTMKDIRDDLHDSLFISKSAYIRDISYYDEYNPDIHKRFLKKEYNTKHVSFETKFPSSLRRLFTQSIRVLKNIVSDETTDFKLLEQALTSIDPTYNDVYLRDLLMNAIKENADSYKYENLLLDNRYKSNDELLTDLEDPNYLITSYDFKLLSKELGVGFMLYTNRYSGKPIKFQTHIVIHKELIKYSLKELSLPMICFYQDEDSLKPIEIEESLLTDLKLMMHSTEFKKVAMKTYRV